MMSPTDTHSDPMRQQIWVLELSIVKMAVIAMYMCVGVKDIIGVWMVYQTEVNNLAQPPGYCLWNINFVCVFCFVPKVACVHDDLRIGFF